MPSLAIIGAQWGDEGKGKITDFLDRDADMIVRFQGGNNAGHTVIINDKVFKLHALPSGVVRAGKISVIGNGTVVNIEELSKEINQVVSAGGSVDDLRISDRAHIVMSYHKKFDRSEEKYRGEQSIGTTGKGIGPAYQDKISRIGFRIGDLFDDDILREKISFMLPYKKELSDIIGSEKCYCTEDSLFKKMIGWRDIISKYICDTSNLINDYLDEGKNVIFEGAQGAMLDIDHGTYPYVTSSSTCSGGICTGSGVAPNRINRIVGIIKSYTTRVGRGSFVTEITNNSDIDLQKKGNEFGVTTGRGRRCGWLDLVACKYASRLCGFTSIGITKLDVLSGIPEIPICIAYEINGEEIKDFPASISRLDIARPVYSIMKGWEDHNKSSKMVDGGYDNLPGNMREYISSVEKYLKIPIDVISIGPSRSETISRISNWWV